MPAVGLRAAGREVRLPGNRTRARRHKQAPPAGARYGRQGNGWQGGMEGTKVELQSTAHPVYSHVTLYDAAGRRIGWMDCRTRERHVEGAA